MSNQPKEIDWDRAQYANYSDNDNLYLPYTDLKWSPSGIPPNQQPLEVNLVDYWGEGRINSYDFITGFPDSININHQYQLVSNGTDRLRKIPNRLPLYDYDAANTSNYLRSSSVLVVTTMGSIIIQKCADDIARIVSKYKGIVIAYDVSQPYLCILSTTLKGIGFLIDDQYPLISKYTEISISPRYTFRSKYAIADSAIDLIEKENEWNNLLRLLNLLANNSFNEQVYTIMNANKFSSNNERYFRFIYFITIESISFSNAIPTIIKRLFRSDKLFMKNQRMDQYLKLGWKKDSEGDHTAYGGRFEESNRDRYLWSFIREYDDYFRITNSYFGLYLKLGWKVDGDGDNTVYGGNIEKDNIDRFLWKIQRTNNENVFKLVNKHFSKFMKLGWKKDGDGDHTSYSGKFESSNEDRFNWILS